MYIFQSAYLVGIADPASEPGHPGLVDQSQFARANQAIQTACQNLTNPASSHQEVRCPIFSVIIKVIYDVNFKSFYIFFFKLEMSNKNNLQGR